MVAAGIEILHVDDKKSRPAGLDRGLGDRVEEISVGVLARIHVVVLFSVVPAKTVISPK
jgi:hypothetical protein